MQHFLPVFLHLPTSLGSQQPPEADLEMQVGRVAAVSLPHGADLITTAHHSAAANVSLLELRVLAPDGRSPGEQMLNQDDLAPVSEGTRRHHPPVGHGIDRID